MTDQKIAGQIAEILLRVRAVTLNVKDGYRWVSGIYSPIYCDNRLLMSYPAEWKAVITSFIHVIKDAGFVFDVIGGVATSGIPHAALIAEKLQKPMIYIRGQQKDHGKENLIEGKLEKGQKVLVIEDLISTGGSSVRAVEAAREQGGVVEACAAIFTYGLEKAKQAFEHAGCSLATLSDFSSLLKKAEEMKYLTSEQRAKVLEWMSDPQGWGKKMGLE